MVGGCSSRKIWSKIVKITQTRATRVLQEHRPTGHHVRCSVSGVARVSAPLLRIPGTAVLLLSPPTTLMWSSLLLPRRRGTITGNQCSVNREQCARSCASFGDQAAGGCAQRCSCGACIGERGQCYRGSCASFGDRAAGGCAE